MGLPVSDVNQMCEVALRMAVEQFQVGDIQAGYRYFKVVQSRSQEIANQIYRQVWLSRGEPQGNPTYGEQCFHDLHGLSTNAQEKSGAITDCLRNLRLIQQFHPLGAADADIEDRPALSTDLFYCPLTRRPFENPVVDPHGHTFENRAIREHLAVHPTCPVSGEPLAPEDLRQNLSLRDWMHAVRATVSMPADVGNHPALSADFYYCPMTHEPFERPMLDPHGHTFEEEAIRDWLEIRPTCPLSQEPLAARDLQQNRPVRELMRAARSAGGMPSEELPLEGRLNFVVTSSMRLIVDLSNSTAEAQNLRMQTRFLVHHIAGLHEENGRLQHSVVEHSTHANTVGGHNQNLSAENRDLRARLQHSENTTRQQEGTIWQQEGTIWQREDTIRQREGTIWQRDERIRMQDIELQRLRRDLANANNRVGVSSVQPARSHLSLCEAVTAITEIMAKTRLC